MCEACDYYSVNESDLQTHVTIHQSRISKQRKGSEEKEVNDASESEEDDGEGEEEDLEEDEEMNDRNSEVDDFDDADMPKKRTKKKQIQKNDVSSQGRSQKRGEIDDELWHKKNFCRRENIENSRGLPFFGNSLDMTLKEEAKEAEGKNSWPQFHTQHSDWECVSLETDSDFLPILDQSISISSSTNCEAESKWRRFKRFEGDLIEGMFKNLFIVNPKLHVINLKKAHL